MGSLIIPAVTLDAAPEKDKINRIPAGEFCVGHPKAKRRVRAPQIGVCPFWEGTFRNEGLVGSCLLLNQTDGADGVSGLADYKKICNHKRNGSQPA